MIARRCLLGVLVLAACASSRRPDQSCEPAGTCDASVPVDGRPEPDGFPLRGFGEPCTDNGQCDSHLCILVGTSGQCTRLCGECPPSYGCLGVAGIEIEGKVSFVCVPTSNQLCTPCTNDSECTLLGMDKCVTYPDGDKTCARDCSSVACPVGYDCETVTIGGASYQQCLASSGACDCTAANPGAIQPCNIPTPWNVCIGAQTCAGATGWGACEPPSPTDDPDGLFADTNCDGLDGDIAKAIFVSSSGSDVASCGQTYSMPCQTIAFGISRATLHGRPHVYVQAGTYGGTLTMVNGVSVFGGYDFNWRRAGYAVPGHTVTLNGGVTGVRFDAITAPTRLDNVVIRSADAVGVGASSIGVLVTRSQQVELSSLMVNAGAGTPGSPGVDGTTGPDGDDGGEGKPGCEDGGAACAGCPQPPGGLPGGSACGHPGGAGGLPGRGSHGGLAGGDGAVGTPGGPGATCHGSRSCDGAIGGTGANGSNGGNGTGGASFGSFSGATYVVASGTSGGDGGHGNGGGGGGGGGGGTTLCDSYGSSGGGGGGGGCGGTHGTPGTGGGGSFGVIALDSLVVIDGSLVTAGSGGAGGRGGTGGGFGAGGNGAFGGAYGGGDEQDDGGDGWLGGNGGHGGRGGDGGGGGGGPSIAVVCLGTSASTVSVFGSTLGGGTAGAGGASGVPGAAGLSAMHAGCAL